MVVTEPPPKLVIGLEFLPYSGTGKMEGVWDAERREANQVEMLRSRQRLSKSMRFQSWGLEPFISPTFNPKNLSHSQGCGRHVADFGIFGHSELVLSGSSSHQILLGILRERSQHLEGFSFLSRDIDWEGIGIFRQNIDGLVVRPHSL